MERKRVKVGLTLSLLAAALVIIPVMAQAQSLYLSAPQVPGGAPTVNYVDAYGNVHQIIDGNRIKNGLPPVTYPNGQGGNTTIWNSGKNRHGR
jgi:hypothetical protein